MKPHEVTAAKFEQLEAMAADPSLTSSELRVDNRALLASHVGVTGLDYPEKFIVFRSFLDSINGKVKPVSGLVSLNAVQHYFPL